MQHAQPTARVTARPAAVKSGLIIAASLVVLTVAVFLVVIVLLPKEPSIPPYDWSISSFGDDVSGAAYKKLAADSEAITDADGFPVIQVANNTPDLGDAAANARYLESLGSVEGKIAIFIQSAGDDRLTYLAYDPDEFWHFADSEEKDKGAPHPFDANAYATNPGECDTVIVIWSRMLRTAANYSPDDRGEAATFVSIFDAQANELKHIEFIGIKMPVHVSSARGTSTNPKYLLNMPAEAMVFISSLTTVQAADARAAAGFSWRTGLPGYSEGFTQNPLFAEFVPTSGEQVADARAIQDRLGILVPGPEHATESEFYIVDGNQAWCFYNDAGDGIVRATFAKTDGYVDLRSEQDYPTHYTLAVDGYSSTAETLLGGVDRNGEVVVLEQALTDGATVLHLSWQHGSDGPTGGSVAWYNQQTGTSSSIECAVSDPNHLVQIAETFIEAQNR